MFEDIMNNNIELTREQKVILYVINTLNTLVEQGLLEGGCFELSEEAKQIVEEMDFEPTEKEIEKVMIYFKQEGHIG